MRIEFSWKVGAGVSSLKGLSRRRIASPDLRPGLMNFVASRLDSVSKAARLAGLALCMASGYYARRLQWRQGRRKG